MVAGHPHSKNWCVHWSFPSKSNQSTITSFEFSRTFGAHSGDADEFSGLHVEKQELKDNYPQTQNDHFRIYSGFDQNVTATHFKARRDASPTVFWCRHQVVQLDLALLLAGTRYRGDFEDNSVGRRWSSFTFHAQKLPEPQKFSKGQGMWPRIVAKMMRVDSFCVESERLPNSWALEKACQIFLFQCADKRNRETKLKKKVACKQIWHFGIGLCCVPG